MAQPRQPLSSLLRRRLLSRASRIDRFGWRERTTPQRRGLVLPLGSSTTTTTTTATPAQEPLLWFSSTSSSSSSSSSTRRWHSGTVAAEGWNLELDSSAARWRRSLVAAPSFSSFFSSSAGDDDEQSSQPSQPSQPKQPPLFRKVLIANRGEIAVRVARTCRRLGISTVAVYAGNDVGSVVHRTECDEAVCLGPETSAYTDVARILEACAEVGADAVHPGYGFLSENAGFAEAVRSAGIGWIGPPPRAIRDMGCKLRSKELAKEAGVATIPGGGGGALESVEAALALLDNDGDGDGDGDDAPLRYPVLLKAAAGGGGKGMRICRNERELREGYPLAKSEGEKFFGDGRLLLERYLEDPHHIEFQVVCGRSGESDVESDDESVVDVAIFAERECSVQRRNQKVVEESPSCLLTEATRRKMSEQTALLCQAVGYEGAGTVEWLVVDRDDDGKKNEDDERRLQEFFFLEMNTRLQVEHPITEAVSSHPVDLVEAMLEVGSGRGLPRDWYDAAASSSSSSSSSASTELGGSGGGGMLLVMPHEGHAIEGRIYAEDPLRGYLPSTGTLVPYKEPSRAIRVADHRDPPTAATTASSSSSSSYLRLDSGVAEGCVVTPFYDPMLSKIISYAPTREEAIEVLSEGLDSYVIEGVRHNADLVRAVLRHPSFRSGDTPTSFLEDEIPDFSEYRYREENSDADEGAARERPGKPSLLSAAEEEELAAAVALIAKARGNLLGRPPVAGDDRAVVVRLDDDDDDAFLVAAADPAESEEDDDSHHRSRTLRVRRLGNDDRDDDDDRVVSAGPVDLDLAGHLARIDLDGIPRTIQVLREDPDGRFKVRMRGAERPRCLVQSLRERELETIAPRLPIAKEDDSLLLRSPMPGTLLRFGRGVEVGATVAFDQELCVVEAMKMQNGLRSPREGTIAEIKAAAGSALVTDQVILEFAAAAADDDDDEDADDETAAASGS